MRITDCNIRPIKELISLTKFLSLFLTHRQRNDVMNRDGNTKLILPARIRLKSSDLVVSVDESQTFGYVFWRPKNSFIAHGLNQMKMK